MSKFQIVKGITDNLEDTPYVEGKVYFTYEDAESEDISIYADIDGVRRKIKEGVQEEELNNYLLKTDIAAWAKEATKPTYTASEVGALSTSHPAATITTNQITQWNNKSDFSGSYNDLTGKPTIPTKTSDLNNDSNFQTSTEVNSAIATAIGNINQFNVAIVSTLPTENIDTHTIYFMSNGGSDDSIYDEWMYINNNWEKIGTTAVDLSGYMQTSHPANGITSTNISNWNAKVSDDKTWNGVTLNKTENTATSDLYIPCTISTSNNSAYFIKALSAAFTAYSLVRRNDKGEIIAATPAANSNGSVTATTAWVNNAITNFITLDDLPIYDGTVV